MTSSTTRSMFFFGAASIALIAVAVTAGPINPPSGPVTSTAKPLADVEPRTAISAANTPGDADSVFRITQSGSYYLTADVVGVSGKSGIEIAVSGATIDLNGFTLQGVSGALDGIRTSGVALHRSTIRNGKITGWPLAGINLTQSGAITGASTLIENVHSSSNTGAGIIAGYSSIVRECTAAVNGGVGISVADGSLIEHCSVRQSGGDGIVADRASSVTDSVSQDNALNGVTLKSGASISRCSASGNAHLGIDGSSFNGGNITDCEASNNSDSGFFAINCLISRCRATANASNGFELNGGCTISDCVARLNTHSGIRLQGPTGNPSVVRACQCSSNGTSSMTGSGIDVASTGNRIEGNSCAGNRTGITVFDTGNIIVRNSCSANTVANWNIAAGNVANVVNGVVAAGFSGNSGGAASSSDPNANFTY